MFSTGYVVLVVDDEPDVIQVSKLAMRNFKVYGNPIKLYTATSKAEALELYRTTLSTQQGLPAVAVAFIDVVMESDTAGLELCDHIRREQGNRETQIFIRTGQPGSAPERSVIDGYDISGYFTKVEATEDKLYSLTKSGIRQYEFLSTGRGLAEITTALVEAGSREAMAGVLDYILASLTADASGQAHQLVDSRVAFLADGQVIARHGSVDEHTVLDAWNAMGDADGTPLGNDGDRFAVIGDRFVLRVSEGDGRAEMGYVAHVPGEVPDAFPYQMYGMMRPFSALWQRAGSVIAGGA